MPDMKCKTATPRRKSCGVGMGLRICSLTALLFMAACSGQKRVNLEPPPTSLTPGQRLAVERNFLLDRMALQTDQAYWPFRLAELQAAAGFDELARTNLAESLSRDPLYTPAISLLSKLHFEAGEFEAGASLLENALAAGAQDKGALRSALALHLDALGDIDAAAQSLDTASETGADLGEIGAALGYVALRGDDYLVSAGLLARAAAAAPSSAAAANNHGIGLLYDGRPIEAQSSFERALDLDPDCAGALYNLAIVHKFYLFEEERAREYFQAYRVLSDEDPDELAPLLAAAAGTGAVAYTKESNDVSP